MELKQRIADSVNQVDASFNRTFMELKPVIRCRRILFVYSFNRTFMELKRDLRAIAALVLLL